MRVMDVDSGTPGNLRRIPWRLTGWSAAFAILLLPAIAMRFTGEVTWDWFDFAAMGLLLGSVGIGLELTAGRSRTISYRAGAGVALIAAFLLIWINLAVGVIGNEANRVNVLFLLVPASAVAGCVVVRFRPAAMAVVMAISAFALVLVPPMAWIFVPGLPTWDIVEASALTGFFAVLWLLSAWLFRLTAQFA
jgi:hypothetical protein